MAAENILRRPITARNPHAAIPNNRRATAPVLQARVELSSFDVAAKLVTREARPS